MSDSSYSTPRYFPRSGRPSISGSQSSPLVRAHFPWATYINRPLSAMSSSYSPAWDASSSTSALPTSVTPQRSAMSSSTTVQVPPALPREDHGIREWTFSAFEWNIRNVRELKEFVETTAPVASSLSSDESQAESGIAYPAVLQQTPMVGDGKFKLEIGRHGAGEDTQLTITPSQSTSSEDTQDLGPTPENAKLAGSLSLCLTSLQLDYSPEAEICTTIMAGIKTNADFAGQRGARTEFVWEVWDEWTFRKGSEFWEYTLPPLSTLLENSRISATDSFILSIQVHFPVGPHFPQQPSAYYVPKDLLEGLEASLDNANTGDVQFVCLERFIGSEENTQPPSHNNRESSGSSSSTGSATPPLTVRKRVIYAHSDILTRRSEYFATLIASSFQETDKSTLLDRGRTIHTIVVEEADFITIYWLLKWIYCDWLLFRENDDPRACVDGMGAGWSARWLPHGGEWEWKTMSSKSGKFEDLVDREEEAASNSVTSESVSAGSMISRGSRRVALPSAAPSTSRASSGNTGAASLRPSTNSASSSTVRRVAKSPTVAVPAASTRGQGSSANPNPPTSPHPSSYPHFSLSASQPRQPPARQPDPHAHPTAPPPAASALSIYQISHRYAIPGLQNLALEHIMSTMTPQSSFPLLLATGFWEELHGLVQDYVVEHWQHVSISEEFEICCQEVAAGDWGPEGGKTLASLFRRLQSPTTLRYVPA